jgi:hypothetical protein
MVNRARRAECPSEGTRLGGSRSGTCRAEGHAIDWTVTLNDLITSERLLIEPLLGSHAELLFEGMSEPRIYRWISALPPLSLELPAAALERRRRTVVPIRKVRSI